MAREGGRRRDKAVLRGALRLHAAARAVVGDYDAAHAAVGHALTPLRDALVRRDLAAMPVAKLAEAAASGRTGESADRVVVQLDDSPPVAVTYESIRV
jgi:hypothetical protein